MDLAIVSLDALPAAITSWQPDAIISAHSPSRPMPAPWDGPWLPMAFHDAEAMGPMDRPWWRLMATEPRPMAHGMGRHKPRMGNHGAGMGRDGQSHGPIMGMAAPHVALPMAHHIEAMATWMDRHGPMRLMVQCHAGLGRAPALAIVAAILAGHGAHEAVMAVHGAVPEASPNRTILRHAEAIAGEPIVSHVDRAWTSRRGRHGALGEAVGLRPVTWQGGGTPPVTGPPHGIQSPQAARGADHALGQPENGVPTLSAGASGGPSPVFSTPDPSVSANRCTGLPGLRAPGDLVSETTSDGSSSAHSQRANCISGTINVAPSERRDSPAHAPGAELDRPGGDHGVGGGDHRS